MCRTVADCSYNLTFQHKIKSLLSVTAGAFGAFSAVSIYKENEKFFDSILMPLVHTLNPETSHKVAIIASKYGLFPKSSYEDPATLVRYSSVSYYSVI